MLITADYDYNAVARILNLPQATAPGQPVTFEQLTAALEAIKWKQDVKAASTGNINLASPGTSIDGVTMALNDRFLAKDQTATAQNGIYIWNGSAVAATRALDANTFLELESAVVQIAPGGTSNGGTAWRQTQTGGVIGTNNIIWTPFGTTVPDATETVAGKSEVATQAEVNTGTDDFRFITALKLANWAGRAKRYEETFGNGSATSYTINHNLNTLAITYSVRNVSTGAEVVTEITGRTVNSITLGVKPAPSTNSLAIAIVA